MGDRLYLNVSAFVSVLFVACGTSNGSVDISTANPSSDNPNDSASSAVDSDSMPEDTSSSSGSTDGGQSCDGVDCSGHGACKEALDGTVFCECADGYMPMGLSCVPRGDATVSHAIDDSGVNGFDLTDRVSYRDEKGLERIAYFARLHTGTMFPNVAGYITRFVWQPDAGTPPLQLSENISGIDAPNSQGWGMNVMHMHYSQTGGFNPHTGSSNHPATSTKRDGYDFEQRPVFLGPHHAIFRTSYKQYTTLHPGTAESPGVDERKAVKVVIDWAFFSGMDHFIYALTLDATEEFVSDDNPFKSDLRTPYCLFYSQSWADLADWTTTSGGPEGQSWGDHKKFITNDMQSWDYGEANTIPFVWEWLSQAADAETGFVQTETWEQKQAGSNFNGGLSASDTQMPSQNNPNGYSGYSYQMNYYDAYGTSKITWGLPYGSADGGFGSSQGYQNYSLASHFGKHSEGGIPRLIEETETIHDGRLTFKATVGSLVVSGPEGSGNSTPHPYSPPGFNSVYRTFEITGEGDKAAWSFETEVGFSSPVFVVWSQTLSDAKEIAVTLNGKDVVATGGCMVSPDSENGRVFITIASRLSGQNDVEVSGK